MAALAVLTVQNTSVPIMMRMARTGQGGSSDANGDYCVPLLVMFQELFKLISSFLLLASEECSLSRAVRLVHYEATQRTSTTLKLAVPAVLYFIMNNSIQHAAAYLPAAVYQVVYQVKILVVALMSVILLGKRLQLFKWSSILSLAVGVGMVQISRAPDSHSATDNFMLGLFYAIISALCSGSSGVYFEMMIKKKTATDTPGRQGKPPSLWLRNIQLAFFSLCFAIPSVYMSPKFNSTEPLKAFDKVVWGLGLNNAVGGLLVALVVKHSNNIQKSFSNAISTVLATVLCIPLFGFEPSFLFAIGCAVVLASTLAYNQVIPCVPACDYIVCGDLKTPSDIEMEGSDKPSSRRKNVLEDSVIELGKVKLMSNGFSENAKRML